MTSQSASALLDRLEDDEAFRTMLESLRDQPEAVTKAIEEAGFHATPDDIKAAFLERYGSELSPEQLDAIAGGADIGASVGVGIGIGVGAGVLLGIVGAIAGAFI